MSKTKMIAGDTVYHDGKLLHEGDEFELSDGFVERFEKMGHHKEGSDGAKKALKKKARNPLNKMGVVPENKSDDNLDDLTGDGEGETKKKKKK